MNPLEWWKAYQHTYPAIHEVAEVVFAIPPTQVTVERAFSALKIVMSDLSSSLWFILNLHLFLNQGVQCALFHSTDSRNFNLKEMNAPSLVFFFVNAEILMKYLSFTHSQKISFKHCYNALFSVVLRSVTLIVKGLKTCF